MGSSLQSTSHSATTDADLAREILEARHESVSVVEMLLAQERSRGGQLAVCDDTHGLRYRDLVARSAGLGSLLANYGVGPGVHVGLFAESSAEMMIGLWGILFAGAAYLPLGSDYPPDRLAYMIRDAGIDVDQRGKRTPIAG